MIPPHLNGLVSGQTERGAYICVHGRQLTVCAVCAPEAERRFLDKVEPETRGSPQIAAAIKNAHRSED